MNKIEGGIGKWGKMGENGGKWGKMGGYGENGGCRIRENRGE